MSDLLERNVSQLSDYYATPDFDDDVDHTDAGHTDLSLIDLLLGRGADTSDSFWDKSLCAQTDPEAFFPEKGGSTRNAKAICARCPIIEECREWALAHDERFGIWGGLSEGERKRELKARGLHEAAAAYDEVDDDTPASTGDEDDIPAIAGLADEDLDSEVAENQFDTIDFEYAEAAELDLQMQRAS